MNGEEVELDLSAGEMDKTSDPIRVYMREMGVVPLLTREQEVSIAKRIERGQKRAEKAIARSPIAVDRKSTRLNSSHSQISYAVFCLKKKKTNRPQTTRA